MKSIQIIIAGIIIAGLEVKIAHAETNQTYLQVLLATNNISKVLNILPKIESLWPAEPETYLLSVNRAAHALNGGQTSESQMAFLNLFTKAMEKPFPTNEAQVASWVELKSQMAAYYLTFDQIKDSPSRLFDIAKFIGEMRLKIIPNYTNQSVNLSGLMLGQPEKMQALIEKNQANERMDKIQGVLRNANTQLSLSFINNCSNLAAKGSMDVKTIERIVVAGRLTDDERAQILIRN